MTVIETRRPVRPVWTDDMRELLGRTPMRVSDLEEMLVKFEVTTDDLERELQASGDVHETADGWVSLIAAADGVVLTHVVEDDELAHGVLVADGDLDLWARLADEGLGLVTGGEVRTCTSGGPAPLPLGVESGLVGPDGWLDAFRPGQLLALRLRGEYLSVEALEAQDPDDEALERCAHVAQHCVAGAAAALTDYLNGGTDLPWELLDDMLASFVVDEAQAFGESIPPLSRLLSGAGLQLDGGFAALPGVPGIAETNDFDAAEIGGLVVAHLALVKMTEGEAHDAEGLRRLLTVLGIPVVAERAADFVEERPLPQDACEALLAAAVSDDQRGLALLLAARSADSQADPRGAERHLQEASRIVPTCWPVALDAAQFAAARGDVVRADALLRAAGCCDDDPLRQAMRPLRKPPEGAISRNRTCPCGSGRKYKVCCLRDVAHPLPARARLVFARLIMHAQRASLFPEVERFSRAVEVKALGLALDLALFDGNVADDYLDRRGHLLPDDERQLVEAWSETLLAPYEVTDVQAGRSLTVRPLLGGDPVVLRDRAFSGCVGRLDVMLARLLWDGSEHVVMSVPTPVHRMRRAAMLALFDGDQYDPDEVASFFRPQRPPKLRNRDGEDVVMCEAVYDVDDGGAWRALAENLGPIEDDGDELVLVGREGAEGERLHRGTVTRDGGRWTVSTNSLERFAELTDLVLDAASEAVLVTESKTPADQAMAEHRERGADPTEESDLPPGHQAAMDEYLRKYELAWVDDEIPALGGRTPRAAVAEGGAALAELEAMLDDMAWMHQQSEHGMDPSRIRQALGIDSGRT